MKFINLGDRYVRADTIIEVRPSRICPRFDSDGTPCVVVDCMHSAGYRPIELVCVSEEERDALAARIVADLEALND